MRRPTRHDPLSRVVQGGLCAGCGACDELGDHVRIGVASNGFIRPEVSRSLDAGEAIRFRSYCPGVGVSVRPAESPSDTDHVIWGPVVASRTAFAVDPAARHNASSGGALTALLCHLLDEGQVDAVIQVAAANEPPYANRTVVSRSPEEVLASAGSRYAPSAPLEGLSERLDGTTRYAFVGKPCDVAALRALAELDPRINAQIPYVLSFFCAGVPSLHGAEEVLERLGVAPDDVAEFRYRGHGWPGRATAVRHDGDSASMSYEASWGGILSRHVQLRCRICPDGVGTHADVVCADAWDTDEAGYPAFVERDGVSLLLSRTAKGEALVARAAAARRLETAPLELSAVDAMQPGQISKATLGPARVLALRSARRPVPRFTDHHPVARSRRARPTELARQYLGTLRRLRQNRLRG